MKLEHRQKRQFREALLSAFRTKTKLKMMLSDELGESLDAVAGGENHTETIFELVEWAEAEGRLIELIRGARRNKPANKELQYFIEKNISFLFGYKDSCIPEQMVISLINNIKVLDKILVFRLGRTK